MAITDYGNSRGIDLIVNAGDAATGSTTWTQLFGMVQKDINPARPEIDVSNDSEGGYMVNIDGASRQITISGTGISTDNAAGYPFLENLHDPNGAGDNAWEFQVVNPASGFIITAQFRITELSLGAAHDGRQEFNLTMISNGAWTRTAIP